MKVNGINYRTIWSDPRCKAVYVIDQTCLPHQFQVNKLENLAEVIHAIKTMQVRGAPLIGATAAYGVAIAMLADESDGHLQHAAESLIASRPTAVNLSWAVKRMVEHLSKLPEGRRNLAAWKEAAHICEQDVAINQKIGEHGLALIKKANKQEVNILTHCNAGWLATVDYGTALAPIYAAHDAGLSVHVWVDETRPRNQGASLTAWELAQHGVPHTVISDNAGGHFMQHGQVDMVIVGADRVTATGDVCNKIGTYLKALAAYDNHVPFYAAVPSPTIDWQLNDGIQEIEIEERSVHEVSHMRGKLANGEIAEVNILPPEDLMIKTQVANPAFDVTPARLVTGIITERGVYAPSLLRTMQS